MRHQLVEFFESKACHWMVGIIVILNALILGAQTFEGWSPSEEKILQTIEPIILCIFTIELVLKIVAMGLPFFKDGWNVFDFLVIVGSLFFDEEIIPILRALRAMHLMSIVDASPKMRHVLSGLWKSMPGITNVLSIVVLFFYIASVMGVSLFRDSGMPEFQHIGVAMKTMFQVLTGDDWANIMKTAEKSYSHAWVFFVAFYVVVVFVILNLFIGIVVGALQSAEQEVYTSSEEEETQAALKKQLARLEKKLDALQCALERR